MLVAIAVILPLCVMMASGYVMRKCGVLDDHANTLINKLIYRLFLPMLLFWNSYSSNLATDFDIWLVLFCVIGVLVIFFASIPLANKSEQTPERRSVFVQGILRSNITMFGLPVMTLLYAQTGSSIISILLVFVIPLLNILGVLIFEIYCAKQVNWYVVAFRILKNPLIIALVLGILANLLHISIMDSVLVSIKSMGSVVTPLAFVNLGGSMKLASISKNWRTLSKMVPARILICPLVMVGAGIILGWRNEALASILLMFGCPTAVASIAFTQELGGDVELASDQVLFSTVLSVLTVFLFIFVLKLTGMI